MTIEVCGLCKRIRGADILKEVSVCARSGRVTGLAGVNGSGKTMLMRAMAGLIRPTSGSVLIDGEELWRDVEFPPSIGLLIENPAFLDDKSGIDNLMLLAGIKHVIDRGQAEKVLELVGLDPFDRRAYRKYSLGMKQRLGLAAAVMESPDVVLLDEPTNALDASGVLMLKDLVRAQRERGACVVLSCHDAGTLRELSDEIYFLSEGRVEGHEMVNAYESEGDQEVGS